MDVYQKSYWATVDIPRDSQQLLSLFLVGTWTDALWDHKEMILTAKRTSSSLEALVQRGTSPGLLLSFHWVEKWIFKFHPNVRRMLPLSQITPPIWGQASIDNQGRCPRCQKGRDDYHQYFHRFFNLYSLDFSEIPLKAEVVLYI